MTEHMVLEGPHNPVPAAKINRIAPTKTPVKVEVGGGATPPKVSLLRSQGSVKAQVGGGATPPKVGLMRSEVPVKAQVGGGATPPKVGLMRSKTK